MNNELTAGDLSGYKCEYCGCWHSYSSEMCRSMSKNTGTVIFVPCETCQNKSREIDRLTKELDIAKDAMEGSCACDFDKDGNIIDRCSFHSIEIGKANTEIYRLKKQNELLDKIITETQDIGMVDYTIELERQIDDLNEKIEKERERADYYYGVFHKVEERLQQLHDYIEGCLV